MDYSRLKLSIEGLSSTNTIPDSVDLSSNFQCVIGKEKCIFTLSKKSTTDYHLDIDYKSRVLDEKVVTLIYDGGVAGVAFEESFVTLYVPRFDSGHSQFGKDWDFTWIGYCLGISNLVILGFLVLLTYIISVKTNTFYIKSFLFRFLDSSNMWYFLVFANIPKPKMVTTFIEGFNNSYWKILRIIPLIEWVEFDDANYPDEIRESTQMLDTEASFLYNLQTLLALLFLSACLKLYLGHKKRVEIASRNWRIFWSIWFRMSVSTGGIWVFVEVVTTEKGVPLVLYLLNIAFIVFNLIVLLGWLLLTEKINNLPYILMTMGKEIESIREEEERNLL